MRPVMHAALASFMCFGLIGMPATFSPATADPEKSGDALYAEAITLFQQGKQEDSFNKLINACDIDHAQSCLILGQQYPKWGADFMDDAFFKSSKACELGLADGCLQAANLLASGRFSSEKFQADQAKHYYLQACKLGSSRGCDLDELAYVPE